MVRDGGRARSRALPKAHLHLHFTGSLSIPALEARRRPRHGATCQARRRHRPRRPTKRLEQVPTPLRRGRAAVREDALRTVAQRRRRGRGPGGWSSRTPRRTPPPWVGSGGPRDAGRSEARLATPGAVGVIVAVPACGTPEARTLAIAARRGQGAGRGVRFGLNNEREGSPRMGGRFRIAAAPGCPASRMAVNCAGRHRGGRRAPEPTRIGHGGASSRTRPAQRMVDKDHSRCAPRRTCSWACSRGDDVRWAAPRRWRTRGPRADDPLFLSRLTDQYATADARARRRGLRAGEVVDRGELRPCRGQAPLARRGRRLARRLLRPDLDCGRPQHHI